MIPLENLALILVATVGLLNAWSQILVTKRQRTLELKIDRAFARILHRHGMTAEAIAVEFGRPAYQVRDWLSNEPPTQTAGR